MPHLEIDECDKDWLGWLNELPSISLAHLREALRLDAELAAGGDRAPLVVLADQPVLVGNIRLYQPTMGAVEYSRTVAGWFADDATMRLLLDGWILAYARRPQVLCRVVAEAQAHRVLRAWSANLGVTITELGTAVAAAWQGFPAPATLTLDADSDMLSWALAMVTQYGGDVDKWIWHTGAAKAIWFSRSQLDSRAERITDKPGYRAALFGLRRLRKELTAAAAANAETADAR